MSSIIGLLIPVAVLAVAIVMILGALNLVRQEPSDGSLQQKGTANLSQKLMRWRVGLQFTAICLIMVSFYLSNG